MKRCLSTLPFLMFVALWISSFADSPCSECETRFIDCPKTYVTPDQIDIHENGIFVRVNDLIIQTQSLQTDTQGIFFTNAKKDDCGMYQWKCTRSDGRGMPCNTCNWDWNYTCSNCGKDKKRNG
jgi:hypothetical protein